MGYAVYDLYEGGVGLADWHEIGRLGRDNVTAIGNRSQCWRMMPLTKDKEEAATIEQRERGHDVDE